MQPVPEAHPLLLQNPGKVVKPLETPGKGSLGMEFQVSRFNFISSNACLGNIRLHALNFTYT